MFPTIAAPFDLDHPAPLHLCPQCGSATVRIAAIIDVVFKPNDPDEPFVDPEFIGLECDWESSSDAWCNECDWTGAASDLLAKPAAEHEEAAA